jgi:hypothetical protein
MCAEASTVLRALASYFCFNCWYLEVPSDSRIRHIPSCTRLSIGNVLEFLPLLQQRICERYHVAVTETGSRQATAVLLASFSFHYIPIYFTSSIHLLKLLKEAITVNIFVVVIISIIYTTTWTLVFIYYYMSIYSVRSRGYTVGIMTETAILVDCVSL